MKKLAGLLLLGMAPVCWGANIYYTVNGSNSTERTGWDYYAGTETMSYRDMSAPNTAVTAFSGSSTALAYRGCDIASINSTPTLFYATGSAGGTQSIVQREWNGTGWGAEQTIVTRSTETIRSMAVGKFGPDGQYVMYYTIDTGRDGHLSTVYESFLNPTTGVWGNDTEVTALRSNNGNQSYMGIAVGDLNGDGTLEMYVSRWLGPTYTSPDIGQYTLVDGQWTYTKRVVTISSVRVASDLAIGDTDDDGKLELIYAEKIGGSGYNYISSLEWNGTAFDSATQLFRDTNNTIDFDGVAVMPVPEPAAISLLALGSLALLRRSAVKL